MTSTLLRRKPSIKILAAGIAAPTACNFQPQRILVIDDDWKRQELARVVPRTDLGLGTIWVMYWDPEQMKQEFSLPEHVEPAALLIAGHKAPDARPRNGHLGSRSLDEILI